MLARRLTTILLAMTLAEAMETTRIHSVAGLTGDRTAWVTTHPFRAQPDTISARGLIGGRGKHTFHQDGSGASSGGHHPPMLMHRGCTRAVKREAGM